MNITMILAAFVCGSPAGTDVDVRVRVALALAIANSPVSAGPGEDLFPRCKCQERCECWGTDTCGCVKPAVEQYRSAFERCKKDGRTLVVFVGQVPTVHANSRCVQWDQLPGVPRQCVLIGRVKAGEYLPPVMLTGMPTDAEIDAAVAGKAPRITQDERLAKWLSQPMHQGTCPCQATGGCHCVPASECAAGKCSNNNPLLRSKASGAFEHPPVRTPPAVPHSMVLPAFGGACRT